MATEVIVLIAGCSAVAAVVFAAAEAADIDDDADDENDQVEAGDGQPGIDHPGVSEGGQRKEDEADEGNEQAVIGALEIIGEKEDQQESDSGKSDEEYEDQARHGGGFAPREFKRKKISNWPTLLNTKRAELSLGRIL
jgi:hypothetical protein